MSVCGGAACLLLGSGGITKLRVIWGGPVLRFLVWGKGGITTLRVILVEVGDVTLFGSGGHKKVTGDLGEGLGCTFPDSFPRAPRTQRPNGEQW